MPWTGLRAGMAVVAVSTLAWLAFLPSRGLVPSTAPSWPGWVETAGFRLCGGVGLCTEHRVFVEDTARREEAARILNASGINPGFCAEHLKHADDPLSFRPVPYDSDCVAFVHPGGRYETQYQLTGWRSTLALGAAAGAILVLLLSGAVVRLAREIKAARRRRRHRHSSRRRSHSSH